MSDSPVSREVAPAGGGNDGTPHRRPVPGGTRLIHGDPSQIAGQPRTHALFWFVLAAAAGVDVVTFHQVLLLAYNETEQMLWTAVTGFTIVSLTLAHFAGIQARHGANPRNVAGARAIAWLCFAIWLSLGVTAFVFRIVVAEPPDSGGSVFNSDVAQPDPTADADTRAKYLSALLFLALYLGSGTISGLGGFVRHNPAAKQYHRAVAQRTKAARRHAYRLSVLRSAEQLRQSIDRVRVRRTAEWQNVERQCDEAAKRLKQEARLHLLAARGPGGPPALPPGPVDSPYPRKDH